MTEDRCRIFHYLEQQAVRQRPCQGRRLDDACRRSETPIHAVTVAERGQAIYESFSLCYEAYRASSPSSFNLHRLSHFPRNLDRVYDEFVEGVDPGYRIDR